jgi:hypothetical protein
MKSVLLIVSLFIATSGWSTCDTIIDTTEIHSVKQIDEHLVIQDTIIIERMIHEVKEQIEEGDNSQHVVEVLVLALVVLSIINHYIKNKRNG